MTDDDDDERRTNAVLWTQRRHTHLQLITTLIRTRHQVRATRLVQRRYHRRRRQVVVVVVVQRL